MSKPLIGIVHCSIQRNLKNQNSNQNSKQKKKKVVISYFIKNYPALGIHRSVGVMDLAHVPNVAV